MLDPVCSKIKHTRMHAHSTHMYTPYARGAHTSMHLGKASTDWVKELVWAQPLATFSERTWAGAGAGRALSLSPPLSPGPAPLRLPPLRCHSPLWSLPAHEQRDTGPVAVVVHL